MHVLHSPGMTSSTLFPGTTAASRVISRYVPDLISPDFQSQASPMLNSFRQECPTEEFMHPVGDLFALVRQGAMTAVCQMNLGIWHHLAIPLLIFAREQNIVFPADNQRRRLLRQQVLLSTLECGTVGANIVEQVDRNICSAWTLQRVIVRLPLLRIDQGWIAYAVDVQIANHVEGEIVFCGLLAAGGRTVLPIRHERPEPWAFAQEQRIVLRDQCRHSVRRSQHHAISDKASEIRRVQNELLDADLVDELANDLAEGVECIERVRTIGHIAVAEARIIRSKNMIVR